jgi:hypothetical protein
MNAKPAVAIFLGICLVLAALLLTHLITPVVSSAIFAIALVLFGSLARGFRKK